jgi:predicted PurR-regulated permease PerM
MAERGGAPLLSAAFMARTLFVVVVVLAAVLIIKLAVLWMLLFGAVVVAVILRGLADPLEAHTPIKGGFAVLAAVIFIAIVLTGVGYVFGHEISQQATDLSTRLPQAWEVLQARLAAHPLGARLLAEGRELGGEASRVFALAPKIAGNIASGLTGLILVCVAGIFLAAQPVSAREGVLSLAPKGSRPRLREVMNACGRALKGWLRAQLVSMVLVGTLVGVGLTLIGVPAPLALGLFAGLAQFVPILGPIVSAVPALLMAALGGVEMFAFTAGLFLLVSQLESNLITPLVQRNVAALPVVFGIFAVIGFGALFGAPGALFATPLALVVYTIVTMLYRQDVLGDTHLEAPGEQRDTN